VAVNDGPLTHMTVFPEQSEIRDVAKLLLALADSPRDVTTTLDPTVGFRVPYWLYESFVTVWDNREAGINVLDNGDVVLTVLDSSELEVIGEAGTEVIEPVKRKPGRPRKEVK
jgi:hypothetical protein